MRHWVGLGGHRKAARLLFRRIFSWAALVLLAGLGGTPVGAQPQPRLELAVLELQSRYVQREVLELFSDELRGEASERLPEHYVFTRENLESRLKEKGIDPSDCAGEDFCEIDVGRKMGVDYIMSGSVLRLGDKLVATIKLHETREGRLIGQRSPEALREDGLRSRLRLAARELFAKVGGGPGSAPPLSARDAASVAISVAPSDAYVQIDSGKLVPMIEGRTSLRIAPGPHRIRLFATGHAPRDTTIHATLTEDLALQFRLRESRAEPPPVAQDGGMLVVDSTPAGASVFLDGAGVGVTPSCTVTPLPPGSYRLRVELPDHHVHEEMVAIKPYERVNIGASLLPAFARVSLETQPPGALIYLNERSPGISPLADLRIPSGELEVKVLLPNYHARDTTLTLSDGQQLALSLGLAPAHGSLRVESDPPGATIILDGRERSERTPAYVPVVSSGTYSLRLELPEHHPVERSVRIQDGQPTRVSVPLRAAFATLDVTSSPDGLPITVNQHKIGRTPLKRVRVDAGQLRVAAEADSLIGAHQEVILAEGDHGQVELRLERKLGAISVISDPPGARVRLDREWLEERTPLIVRGCATGERRVHFELDDHLPVDETVTVGWREQPVVRVKLVSYAGTELATANRWRSRKRWSLSTMVLAGGGAAGAWFAAESSYGDYEAAGTSEAATSARSRTESLDLVTAVCGGVAAAMAVATGLSMAKESAARGRYEDRRRSAMEIERGWRLVALPSRAGVSLGLATEF